MKKRLIIIIAACVVAVVVASTLIGVFACNGNRNKNAYTVYSAPNTVKVMRSEDYMDKGSAILNFEMAKNEYESAQIIVNSKEDTTFNAVIEKDLVSKEIEFLNQTLAVMRSIMLNAQPQPDHSLLVFTQML